ncbi:hypothetical protein GCM10023184_17730 [Flaviaesturariibacter amylovorans]|uniref:Uncharacterized protein n=1 Tax=Flaviaesturariibacter amylovorans TaxID=1084520 RepID=A0ABP8GPN1_9BACT
MNIYMFNSLTSPEKLKIWLQSAEIGRRLGERGEAIVCRQIAGFYAEYERGGNGWKYARTFTNPDLLAPYLDQIDIGEVS